MASIFPVADTQTVQIPAGDVTLTGDVVLPPGARGLIVFAHGSGSSRTSPRNRRVARVLNHGGFGTLLFDLLTQAEEVADDITGHLRFDIEFLADRLVDTLDWTNREHHLPASLGLFGASTGAAAALMAADRRADRVAAVVSRGGRPDLAAGALPHVTAPTLLIVGGNDTEVIELNKEALALMQCEKELVLVDRATHLFEEAGALDEVARLALDWFERHMGAS
jgi:pimeloyl-ACP methyl ester carboxylesterase